MNVYRCYLLAPNSKSRRTTIQSDSDAHARELALQILRNCPEVESLEAWREADFAFRLNRHTVNLESR